MITCSIHQFLKVIPEKKCGDKAPPHLVRLLCVIFAKYHAGFWTNLFENLHGAKYRLEKNK